MGRYDWVSVIKCSMDLRDFVVEQTGPPELGLPSFRSKHASKQASKQCYSFNSRKLDIKPHLLMPTNPPITPSHPLNLNHRAPCKTRIGLPTRNKSHPLRRQLPWLDTAAAIAQSLPEEVGQWARRHMRLEQLSLQRRRLLLHAGPPHPAARSHHANRIAQHDVVVHQVRGTTKNFYVRGTSRASQLLERVTEITGWPKVQCYYSYNIILQLQSPAPSG